MSKKRIENFDTPQQKAQKSSQKILKFGCLACFAIACVFTAQNLMPLDFYVNPGIDENTKFVVAHAGGGMTVDGKTRKYLNVVEGVEHHYAHGTRMFEIDFAFSKENELVGTHRYEYLKGFSNKNRIGIEEYKNKLILDKFHGLTSERLFELMQKYPDAKFIIDTKENEPFLVYEKLIGDANAYGINLKESVIPFVSSKKMLEKIEAARATKKSTIFTSFQQTFRELKLMNSTNLEYEFLPTWTTVLFFISLLIMAAQEYFLMT